MRYSLTLLALLCSTAFAADLEIAWQLPEGSEECTPVVDAPAFAGFKVYELIADIPDPTATSVVLPAREPGDYSFVAVTYNVEGAESRFSNRVDKTASTFVTSDTKVYTMFSVTNGIGLAVVGSVPLGTPCDPAENVKGLYAVPVDQITVPPTTRILLALAECK